MPSFSRKKRERTGSPRAAKENRSSLRPWIRIHVLAFFIFFVTFSILGKLFMLQVAAYDLYKTLADDQHSVFKDLVPKRGEIYSSEKKGNYPLAVNKETKMAYAVPKEIENPSRTAAIVSQALQIDEHELEEKFSQPEDMYEVVKHRLTDGEIENINSLKLEGIHLADESYRYYPAGELASHILGYVGWKGTEFGGRYGAELFFERELKGEPGNIFQNKDAAGRWISTGEKEISHAKDGDTLVLSIDHIIQYEAERLLGSAISKHSADRGAVIVMEPFTGRILAMANYPMFNPNDYASVENMESFRNLAVSDAYEPGSVFKAITLAAAVDSGRIEPQTTYFDSGAVAESGYTIRNSDLKSYGKQTMTEVLEKSLNTGVIYAEKLLGNKNFYDYVKRFGFGEATGIDAYGEAGGNIGNLKNLKSDIQFFTASFGQGITVTPIQLLSAYNAIASDGVLTKPKIVKEIIRSDGSKEEILPEETRRVITSRAAQKASEMLLSVVERGHGKRAGVPGYLVGGKTGTAQVARSDAKGYEADKSIGTFAGFAPIDNPKYTVLVRIDNPKDVQWAESSAAPLFGELMKFLLEYGSIEPTEKYTQKELDEFNATHNLKALAREREEEEKKKEEEEKK